MLHLIEVIGLLQFFLSLSLHPVTLFSLLSPVFFDLFVLDLLDVSLRHVLSLCLFKGFLQYVSVDLLPYAFSY